ncbi:hypothetical protein MPTK2_2g22200 [Marchantia polymorpha subsp. ruderalis]
MRQMKFMHASDIVETRPKGDRESLYGSFPSATELLRSGPTAHGTEPGHEPRRDRKNLKESSHGSQQQRACTHQIRLSGRDRVGLETDDHLPMRGVKERADDDHARDALEDHDRDRGHGRSCSYHVGS